MVALSVGVAITDTFALLSLQPKPDSGSRCERLFPNLLQK